MTRVENIEQLKACINTLIEKRTYSMLIENYGLSFF